MIGVWSSGRLLHDLRSPIEAARSSLLLLQARHDAALPEAARRLVVLARGGVEEAYGLLEASALQGASGRPASRIETVDADAELRSVAAELDVPEGALDSSLLPRVRADALALRRVMRNLLLNALAHGKPPVRVRAAKASGAVMISFSDSGPGIPLEDQWRILLPREGGAHGLGLSNSLQLVDQMGGKLWIDSAPGRGTTIHFTLPPSS